MASCLSSTEANWSSIDVDAPYTWCDGVYIDLAYGT